MPLSLSIPTKTSLLINQQSHESTVCVILIVVLDCIAFTFASKNTFENIFIQFAFLLLTIFVTDMTCKLIKVHNIYGNFQLKAGIFIKYT